MGNDPSKRFSCMPDYWVATPIITQKTCTVLQQSLHNIVTGNGATKMCHFTKFYDAFYKWLDKTQTTNDSISHLFEHDMDKKSLFLVRLLKTCELIAEDFVSKKKRQETKANVLLLFEDTKGASTVAYSDIGEALFNGVSLCDPAYTNDVSTAWLHAYSLLLRRLVPLVAAVHKRSSSSTFSRASFSFSEPNDRTVEYKRAATFGHSSRSHIPSNSKQQQQQQHTSRRRVVVPTRSKTLPSRRRSPPQTRNSLSPSYDDDDSDGNSSNSSRGSISSVPDPAKKVSRPSLKARLNTFSRLTKKKNAEKPHVRFIMDRIDMDGKEGSSEAGDKSTPPTTTASKAKRARHRKADSWSSVKLFTYAIRRNLTLDSSKPDERLYGAAALREIFPDKTPVDAERQLKKLENLTSMQNRGDKIRSRARGRPRSYSADTYNDDYR